MGQKKLDKKKIESYKKQLLKLKEDTLHDIDNMKNNPVSEGGESGDVSGHVLHMADVATDMYDREFNLGLASTEQEVIRKIDIALKKIGDKSYGNCINCKKPIPDVRLNALPYVETCLKCQEEIESKK